MTSPLITDALTTIKMNAEFVEFFLFFFQFGKLSLLGKEVLLTGTKSITFVQEWRINALSN
jgi:hypothetical protein